MYLYRMLGANFHSIIINVIKKAHQTKMGFFCIDLKYQISFEVLFHLYLGYAKQIVDQISKDSR